MIFNASKTKCIVVECRHKINSVSSCRNVQFTIGGSHIEIVDSWPHLGHVISCNLDDKLDIERSPNKLVAQVNSVLCNFVSVDSIVKMNLLKNYCLSLYGCELHGTSGIQELTGFVSHGVWWCDVFGVYRMIVEHVYTVSQKTVQNCFCQNFVKFSPILIIFGRKMAKRLKLYEVYSFSTLPNLCRHTTVLNADVPNCYKAL